MAQLQLNPNQPKGSRELSLQHLADKYGVTLEQAKAMHQRVADLAAAEVGVAEEETRRVLESDEYVDEVQDDIRTARELGITGVPFFVIDRKYGISGAQLAEAFLQALQTARSSAA